ncbi:GntR family transcriptional regulator [Catellatospora coxensis]
MMLTPGIGGSPVRERGVIGGADPGVIHATAYELSQDRRRPGRPDQVREYPAGSQLPTYNELADLYSVSFSTITRVIGVLRLTGVVVGVPGRGTFVPEKD